LLSSCYEGEKYHPVDQETVCRHFMFGGMVRGEIDCSICCCGFSEYVNFYFGGGGGGS
jgi:hypothetical protein